MNRLRNEKRWLCIAYAFPPINRSGTHRSVAFVRGLFAEGWRASVLTVEPPSGEPIDQRLMEDIPQNVQVVRASWCRPVEAILRHLKSPCREQRFERAGSQTTTTPGSGLRKWKEAIKALFTIPDSRVGWIVPALWRGLAIIRRSRPQVLYSTSPYASAHVIALLLHSMTRIPWVADFRDPWCGNPFQPRRAPLVERLDAWLERCVFRHATRIVCNTPTMRENFLSRHPSAAPRCVTILNGIDTESLNQVRPRRLVSKDQFAFVHCGQFYGPRSPIPLLEAFRRFLIDSPHQRDRVRLIFVGAASYQNRPLFEFAKDAGVEKQVVVCGEISHAEALACCAGADGLVLVGANGPGSDLQVPQKLFEYLHIRRPILALLAERNPGCAILHEASFDGSIVSPTDVATIASTIRALSDPGRVAPSDAWNKVPRFDRRERVRELNGVFEEVCAYVVARPETGPRSRLYTNTITASIKSMAASAKSTVATQATLLPDAP